MSNDFGKCRICDKPLEKAGRLLCGSRCAKIYNQTSVLFNRPGVKAKISSMRNARKSYIGGPVRTMQISDDSMKQCTYRYCHLYGVGYRCPVCAENEILNDIRNVRQAESKQLLRHNRKRGFLHCLFLNLLRRLKRSFGWQ